jgi:hypothetical protein
MLRGQTRTTHVCNPPRVVLAEDDAIAIGQRWRCPVCARVFLLDHEAAWQALVKGALVL